MNRQRRTASEQATIEAGIELASCLVGGVVIAMEGPLGAGKTCLARGIAIGLGVEARAVASPTFAIVHEHATSDACPAKTMYHLDAYRLSGPEDLESIGWSEIIGDPGGVVLIEWASRIEAALPNDAWRIDVNYDASDGRLLQLETSCDDVGGQAVESTWDGPDDSLAGRD
jgi:tRNA threonylcarbamoyladenosine biosynthesis protein TsaE